MSKREATALSKRIEREMPSCHVTGFRHHEDGSYAIDVIETKNGTEFAVYSVEDWEERVREASEPIEYPGDPPRRPGRPAGPAGRMPATAITLPREHIEYLRTLGEGNVSAGVRKLVEDRQA